jgi:cold shock CspA family protein
MGAVVMWFNPIVGGKVLCADGQECFVPLVKIPDQYHRSAMQEGAFPVLLPQQQVLLRYTGGPKGRSATEILPIEVPESDDE